MPRFVEQKGTDWLAQMLRRRLLIHVGKGGVGRSVLTAAVAQLAAAEGKRVLVCEINSKERMSSLLGGRKPEQFDDLDEIWQPQKNIWAVNIRPWAGMKQYVSEVLKMRLIFNLVFENNAMRYFLRAVPGLQELVFIGKIWFHVSQTLPSGRPRFDLVIVDAPATGHGLALLRIPQVVLDVTPPGPMRTATQRIQNLLADSEKTWIQLATLPEEMPVNETIELYNKLRDLLDLPVGFAWMNQWPTPICAASHQALFEQLLAPGLASEEGWPYFAAAQAVQLTQKKAQQHFKELRSALHVPVFQVPRISSSAGDERQLTQALVQVLRDLLQTQPLHTSEPPSLANVG